MNKEFRLQLLIQSLVMLLLMVATVYATATESGYFLTLAQQGALPNNQTGIGSVSSENQSTDAMGNTTEDRSSSNLTRGDLDPVLNNLFTARENLLRNNLISTLDSLNDAGRELFKLNITMSDDESTDRSLTPLHKQIEYARIMVLNSNSSAALRHLNSADTEFIIVAQELH